jgi:glycogen debranching enzyme
MASYIRHGLLPNFLDNGRHPRYNARDVCWWFLKGVRDYLDFTEDYQIFNADIEIKFQDDDVIQQLNK